MSRCTESEQKQIFDLINSDGDYNVKITKEQALQIAEILQEEVDHEKLDRLVEYGKGKVLLNSWINGLRFYRIKKKTDEENHKNQIKKKQLAGMAEYATALAANTVQHATTDEERARGQRETNAAAALTSGDISGAFRSLSYFQDR